MSDHDQGGAVDRSRGGEAEFRGFLARVRRRLRLQRALETTGTVLAVVVLPAVALALALRLLAPAARWGTAPLVIALPAALVYLAWRLSRPLPMARAAATVDARAGLQDEVKSAWCFATEGPDTPWTALQTSRAVARTRPLSARRLMPMHVPRRLTASLGVLALLLPAWGLLGGAPPARSSPEDDPVGAVDAAVAAELDQIRELLARAEELEAGADESDHEPVALMQLSDEELDALLRGLREGALAPEAALQDLDRLRQALEAGNLRVGDLREGLEALSEALEGELQDLAEALADEDLQEAARLLRELAQQVGDEELGAARREELDEALERAGAQEPAGLEELLDRLRGAREMLERDPDAARRALERAAQELERLSSSMDAQLLRNQAAERVQSVGRRLGRQQGAADMARFRAAPDQAGLQMTGLTTPSDQVQLQALAQFEGGDLPQGESLGHASGPGFGDADTEGEPTRLDVELEERLVFAEEDPEEGEVVEEATRQQPSVLEFLGGPGSAAYSRGDPVERIAIPWRFRRLVIDYFAAIRDDTVLRDDAAGRDDTARRGDDREPPGPESPKPGPRSEKR